MGFATFAMSTRLSSGPNRGGEGGGQMTFLLFLSLLSSLTVSTRRDCIEVEIEYDKMCSFRSLSLSLNVRVLRKKITKRFAG